MRPQAAHSPKRWPFGPLPVSWLSGPLSVSSRWSCENTRATKIHEENQSRNTIRTIRAYIRNFPNHTVDRCRFIPAGFPYCSLAFVVHLNLLVLTRGEFVVHFCAINVW